MQEVKIWEEDTVIPTYEVGKPDKNPMFLEKRVYQGSSGKIYPYPSTQEISRTKTDHTWKAVWLENEYLKVMILPELGGRIQRAFDKTNAYDFVYYNHVIKPALVGLTGPWISGGIEFNWPQHHRPTTFSPVDHRIVSHEDGSKSLVIGDVDQMNGTKENTTFTLYPGKAYIEIRGQLYNRTPLPQTFLWWANPAVAVNEDTQSVFPPDVHTVYDHGKRAVSRFPIATGEYYKHDYSEGVDISRYKNIPVPTSYMAEESSYDFVGGYDYGKKAGLLHVADHHISPGKKQWTWGCGEFGKAWDRNLTDEDGPYIELMTGMYCDNQPDFSWLSPHEEKVFYQYFMPYKGVAQVKNATIHAALNVEQEEQGLHILAYATQVYENATVLVYDRERKIFSENVKLSPVDVYDRHVKLGVEDFYRIRTVISAEGKELVSYQAADPGIPVLAEPARAPKAPGEVLTNEELYLIGQHIEQYRHATFLPDSYYLEGLKRDEGDTRINQAYGQLLMRRGDFEGAQKHLKKALVRLTGMHPNPYDSEPYYYLGLALLYQGKRGEAFDAFYKATWKSELQEMAFYYLAAILTGDGEYEEAYALVNKGLVKNSHNVKALGLLAYLMIRLGKPEEAEKQIAQNLAVDCFDYVSLFLRMQLEKDDSGAAETFHQRSRDFDETYLQTARDLAEFGAVDEALSLLSLYPGERPMIYYYQGFYLWKLGKEEAARVAFQKAEKCDPFCTFPNKPEEIEILKTAMRVNPEGAKAPYYLGCLFYDKLQFAKAVTLWERSKDLDDTYPTLLRNLSIAYYNKCNKPEEARACLERAFALDRTDARVFLELDQLYQRLQIPSEERLARYEENLALIEGRDDLTIEYVTLLNNCGEHQKALALIQKHTFRTWEGAEGKITAQFQMSLLSLAKDALAAGEYESAREKLQEAISYPSNLGEGRLEGTKNNHIHYHLGLVWEAMGEHAQAKESFEAATLGAMEVAGMMYYYDQPADMILYQGLAKEKLHEKKAAKARFYRLIDYGEQHLRDTFQMDYFAVSMPDMSVFDTDMNRKNEAHCYYLMGLGKLGLGQKEAAAGDFRRVLEIDRNHQKARWYLKGCASL